MWWRWSVYPWKRKVILSILIGALAFGLFDIAIFSLWSVNIVNGSPGRYSPLRSQEYIIARHSFSSCEYRRSIDVNAVEECNIISWSILFGVHWRRITDISCGLASVYKMVLMDWSKYPTHEFEFNACYTFSNEHSQLLPNARIFLFVIVFSEVVLSHLKI